MIKHQLLYSSIPCSISTSAAQDISTVELDLTLSSAARRTKALGTGVLHSRTEQGLREFFLKMHLHNDPSADSSSEAKQTEPFQG